MPPVSDLTAFNRFILGFWMCGGPADVRFRSLPPTYGRHALQADDVRIGGPWSRGGSTNHMQNANIWANFDDDYRQTVIQQYHNAGIALMVSAFGSTGECFRSHGHPAT
jgi:hypothetical protein